MVETLNDSQDSGSNEEEPIVTLSPIKDATIHDPESISSFHCR